MKKKIFGNTLYKYAKHECRYKKKRVKITYLQYARNTFATTPA